MTLSLAARRTPSGHALARPAEYGHSVAPFFVSATLFLLVAGALALAHAAPGPLVPALAAWRWPILHLAFVGGVSQLIVGAMTLFATTLLRTTAPPGWLTGAQWLLINSGALALVGGVRAGQPVVAAVGGLAVLSALALLALALLLLHRRSLGGGGLTLHYYLAAIVCLAVGATLGVLMVLGLGDPMLPRGQVRLAHLHLNLNGWVTLTIVGTMQLFFGTALGAPARHLNPPWVEFWPLAIGVGLSSFGWLVGQPAIIGLGSLLQLVGILAYSASIFRQWRAHTGPLSLAAGHLLAGTSWLLVMTLGGLLAAVVRSRSPEVATVLTGTVVAIGYVGFIGQTVLGAWSHLFPVVLMAPARLAVRPAPWLGARVEAIVRGQRRGQLVLTNLGIGGVVLGQVLERLAPALATPVWTAGLLALAAVLALISSKAGRALYLVRWAGRPPLPRSL